MKKKVKKSLDWCDEFKTIHEYNSIKNNKMVKCNKIYGNRVMYVVC